MKIYENMFQPDGVFLSFSETQLVQSDFHALSHVDKASMVSSATRSHTQPHAAAAGCSQGIGERKPHGHVDDA